MAQLKLHNDTQLDFDLCFEFDAGRLAKGFPKPKYIEAHKMITVKFELHGKPHSEEEKQTHEARMIRGMCKISKMGKEGDLVCEFECLEGKTSYFRKGLCIGLKDVELLTKDESVQDKIYWEATIYDKK